MEDAVTWKRPSVVLKKQKKKKSASSQGSTTAPIHHGAAVNKSESASVKRKNPFSSIDIHSKKTKHVSSEEEYSKPRCDSTSMFFAVLDNAEMKNGGTSHIRVEKAIEGGKITRDTVLDEDEVSQFDFIEKFSIAQFSKSQNNSPQLDEEKTADAVNTKAVVGEDSDIKVKKCQKVPVDWSLKVKLRVVSSNSLVWCTQLKTAEEAKGVIDYVSNNIQNPSSQVDEKSWFQSCCLYWMYPSMPWLRLFPRIIPDSKMRTTSVSLLDPAVSTEIQNDWTESFLSVYHQLRSQRCPYFYVCTHQFTVLFRTMGVAGQTTVNAFLTPTTRGFREALKKEGIEFTMPVLDKKRNTTKQSENAAGKSDNTDAGNATESSKLNQADKTDEDEEERDEYDDDFLETDEGASVWLESIGLDKKQFPSLDPDKVKIQKEGFRVIDNRPESLLYVQGGDVQGLFNYLLNCRSCISTTGPLAGVPPTILAPGPFKGATLKSHKVKHSIVRQKEMDFRSKPMHILEIAGPIIPHHVQGLSSLFAHTQDKDFSLTFNTHDPTVPFNFQLHENEDSCVDKGKEREKLNMTEEVHDAFFEHLDLSDRLSCIKELHRDKDGYSWTT